MTTRYVDDAYTFYAVSTRFDTGVATDADAVLPYRVYEEETTTPILTGNMALLDSANTAGFYSEQITLSAANGFEVGKCYCVHIGGTVNSIAGAATREFVVRKKPLTPTIEGRELDVSAGGEAGIDLANVGSPTTSLALTGTTIATTQKVDVETIKTNPVVNAGTITFPTGATLASTTNITAGTITTATNLTNAPTAGDLTATMKTSVGTAVAASAVASVTGNVGSVTGLTPAHLEELWAIAGLDIANAMTVTPTSRVSGSISQTISGDAITTTTVTRDP